MKTFVSSSKPANFRDSLQQHVHLYALAASAAGVSMLAKGASEVRAWRLRKEFTSKSETK